MPRYRTTISSSDREAMLDLVRKHKVQIDEHSSRTTESGSYSVDAILELADMEKLEQAGYHVRRHEDVDETGKARQKEVGRGDRYKDKEPSSR
jgi:hypothetical protein